MDVDDHRAILEVHDELRQRREHLLEEHRDVLDREALDRHAVAVRTAGQRLPAAEHVGQAREVEAADRGVQELAAQVLGSIGVQEHAGDVVEQHDPVAASSTRSWTSAPHAQRRTSSISVPVCSASASAVSPSGPATRSRSRRPSSSPTYTNQVR